MIQPLQQYLASNRRAQEPLNIIMNSILTRNWEVLSGLVVNKRSSQLIWLVIKSISQEKALYCPQIMDSTVSNRITKKRSYRNNSRRRKRFSRSTTCCLRTWKSPVALTAIAGYCTRATTTLLLIVSWKTDPSGQKLTALRLAFSTLNGRRTARTFALIF